MRLHLIAAWLAGSLVAGPAAAQSIKLTVPKHVIWCAQSNPIKLADLQSPGSADAVFRGLFQNIEASALKAGLTSVGVPFFAHAADAPPNDKTTVSIKVCSVVPSDAQLPADPSGPPIVQQSVEAQQVYAAVCPVDTIGECRDQMAAQFKPKFAGGFSSSPCSDSIFCQSPFWRLDTRLRNDCAFNALASPCMDTNRKRFHA
jgi:hypothetical protein